MSKLVNISAIAPQARMVEAAAKAFEQLREIVKKGSGVDFLARCGDVLRDPTFRSSKDGVANRSWHKTGRAFDYDQTSARLVIVSEPKGGTQFFRTYLRCSVQDGSLGKKQRVRDYRGHFVDAYLFDFTAAAEKLQFNRIAAWSGWQRSYNRREFWHYQFNPDGLTWDAAMLDILSTPKARKPADTVIGRNDRGDAVKAIQQALNKLGLLPAKEIDGIFGVKTANAVATFQVKHGLARDGLVGPNTRKALEVAAK